MNLKLMIYGAIIGVANIIPGVSGGTMAVILNIYDKLIQSISNLRRDFVNSMKFLIPIGIGGGAGILAFSKLIEFSLERFSIATNLVFVGLIIGSIPMMYGQVKQTKVEPISILVGILTLAAMVYMGVANPDDSSGHVITVLSFGSFMNLFLTSIIAAGAMIIPGVSGSFILLLLGTYTTILTAVSNLNVLVLVPVGLGCIVGVLGCAKILDKLFSYFPQQTYAGILGLMIGSITVIAPLTGFGLEYIVGIILATVASVVAYIFSK